MIYHINGEIVEVKRVARQRLRIKSEFRRGGGGGLKFESLKRRVSIALGVGGLSEDCCNSSFISVNSVQRSPIQREWGNGHDLSRVLQDSQIASGVVLVTPRFCPEFRKDAADYAHRACFEHDAEAKR